MYLAVAKLCPQQDHEGISGRETNICIAKRSFGNVVRKRIKESLAAGGLKVIRLPS
jgi:hypothetical protein